MTYFLQSLLNFLQIYFYMPSVESSGKFPTLIPAGQFEHPSLAYIDLDLPKTAAADRGTPLTQPRTRTVPRTATSALAPGATLPTVSPSANSSSTAYKSIDFVRTEAFNRTRHKVEEKYKKEN